MTLRWPPLLEDLVRLFNSRLNTEYEHFEHQISQLPEDAGDEQHDETYSRYEERCEKIFEEFEQAAENPAAYLANKVSPEDPARERAWSLAELRYERWVFTAAERIAGAVAPANLSEAEGYLLGALTELEVGDREDAALVTTILLDICGAETWYAQEGPKIVSVGEGDKLHVDVANVDTLKVKRIILTPDDLLATSPEELRMLHGSLAAEVPLPKFDLVGEANEALGILSEMESTLFDLWEMAEDTNIAEEVLRVRHAMNELGWSLSMVESGETIGPIDPSDD